MPERLIDILNDLAGSLDIPILTSDYQILLPLLDDRRLSVIGLIENFTFSRASFFNSLSKLRGSGAIHQARCDRDGRRKYYEINDYAAQYIVDTISEYVFPKYKEKYRQNLHKSRLNINKIISEDLTLESKIIFYLYYIPNSTNSTLRTAVLGSSTKFNSCLSNLVDSRFIHMKRDLNDLRRRVYKLDDHVTEQIHNTNSRLGHWVNSYYERVEESATYP